MQLRKLPVYLALAGATACGPAAPTDTTVFRVDTDECRITRAETPFLDIEVEYGHTFIPDYILESRGHSDNWKARGRYNSATGAVEGAQHNHEYFRMIDEANGIPHLEYVWDTHARTLVAQCAENDPLRRQRPIGFAVDESSFEK